MPSAINKHRITLDGQPTSIRHQRGAEIKHFGIIGGNAFIWLHEQEGQRTTRYNYRTISTGHPVPDYWDYVATAQDPATGISAHLFKENA